MQQKLRYDYQKKFLENRIAAPPSKVCTHKLYQCTRPIVPMYQLHQTDRHFPKIVNSCSRHPKTRKSMKNRKSKICTEPLLFSIYVEESKKKLH